MNAEIVERLEFTFRAHPQAPLIRALIDMQEKLLAGKDELEIPHGLEDAIRDLADRRGLSAQKLLTRLLIEAMNHLDEQTDLGKELERHIFEVEHEGKELPGSHPPRSDDVNWSIVRPFIQRGDQDVVAAMMAADLSGAATIALKKRKSDERQSG